MSDSEEEDVGEKSPMLIDLTVEGKTEKPSKKRRKRDKSKSDMDRNSKSKLGQLSTKDVQKGLKDNTFELMPVTDGKSDMWKTFARVGVAGTHEKLDFAGCINCNLVYKFTRSTGTTAFVEHAGNCVSKSHGKDEGPINKFLKKTVPQELKRNIYTALAQ